MYLARVLAVLGVRIETAAQVTIQAQNRCRAALATSFASTVKIQAVRYSRKASVIAMCACREQGL